MTYYWCLLSATYYPLFYSFSFFFCGSCIHHLLHSFPTRRSSDLGGRRRGGPAPRRARAAPGRRSPPQPPRRSEEHTSELQSPDHLVCRLLLEKKKKYNSYQDTGRFTVCRLDACSSIYSASVSAAS